jgi:murein L,D-transpeptidase YcbB/YkuD
MGLSVVLLLAVLTATAACDRITNEQHAPGIRRALAGTPTWIDRSSLGRQLWGIERTFYESRTHMPVWIDRTRPTSQMDALVEELRGAATHGLDPARYGLEGIERALVEADGRFGVRFEAEAVPQLDARLTYAYLSLAADLLGWRTNPAQVSAHWQLAPKKDDLAARLTAAVGDNRVHESLEELAPAHPQYAGLRAALVREREQPTGQADRIRMNLERWRWSPRDLGARYVLINVPAYVLQVMEGDHSALAMRVVVGQPDWPTPLFSDEMTYVVFSPYWNIPENILREETLPRVARDPDFLRRNNIEVVGTSGAIDPEEIDWTDESVTSAIRLRQRPGPDNALGLVKFIFPNNFSIYLHDTPSERLFARARRALSHGCIRVEDPIALARYVLRDQPEWTDARVQGAMHARQERYVKLTEPIPVHIGYWTAWVGHDGQVIFTDDPYGIDRAHTRVLGAWSSHGAKGSETRRVAGSA